MLISGAPGCWAACLSIELERCQAVPKTKTSRIFSLGRPIRQTASGPQTLKTLGLQSWGHLLRTPAGFSWSLALDSSNISKALSCEQNNLGSTNWHFPKEYFFNRKFQPALKRTMALNCKYDIRSKKILNFIFLSDCRE